MPTKALIHSAAVMHLVARRAAEFGVRVEGSIGFDLREAVARKDAIVGGIKNGIHEALDRRTEVIDFLQSDVAFTSEHEVDTGERTVSFDKAIIATGARNTLPKIEGLEAVDVLDNRTALTLREVPSSLIVIGGGYIGVEFAQMYARFGTRVTLLGRNEQLAPGEDSELSELLAEALRHEGIDVRTAAPVTSIREQGTVKVVVAHTEGGAREFVAEAVLVATGRRANTESLRAEAAGIELEHDGAVRVDDTLATSQPHIWAIGDVKGGWMFTHVATYDGPIAALNAVKGLDRRVDYRVVPRAVFSDPVLSAVGLTEREARDRGIEVKVGNVPVGGARAKAIGESRGRLKAVVSAESGEILGFHMLAPHGDDLLHEAVSAMHGRGSIERISKSIHIHPTLSEMVKSAARAAR